jgi:hypothetical protein
MRKEYTLGIVIGIAMIVGLFGLSAYRQNDTSSTTIHVMLSSW